MKLIQHWGLVLIGMFVFGIMLAAEFKAYYDQPSIPVVCKFVEWDGVKNNSPKMKLKCGDQEYYSSDAKLVLWHINNPDKEIRGMVNLSGEVREAE